MRATCSSSSGNGAALSARGNMATISDEVVEEWLKRSRRKNGPLERKFSKELLKTTGERAIHLLLKLNDFLIGMAFKTSTHPRGVFSEFRLGQDFRSDYVAVSSCSGWYDVNFIELESPKERLFLKDGTPSKPLRIAQRQISDWKDWYRKNENTLRTALIDLFSKANMHATGAISEVADAADELGNPNCALTCRFWIVVGRRDSLSKLDDQRRGIELNENEISICTYDRILEAARRYDQADRITKEGFRYWKGG